MKRCFSRHDLPCKNLKELCFPALRLFFHYSCRFFFCLRKQTASWNFHTHRKPDSLRKCFHFSALISSSPAVVDDSCNSILIRIQISDSLKNVVCRIKSHSLPAGHEKYGFCILLSHRNCKAAAHYIAQHIINYMVISLAHLKTIQKLKGCQDTSSGTAHTRFGASGFHAAGPPVALHENSIQALLIRRRI